VRQKDHQSPPGPKSIPLLYDFCCLAAPTQLPRQRFSSRRSTAAFKNKLSAAAALGAQTNLFENGLFYFSLHKTLCWHLLMTLGERDSLIPLYCRRYC
jgi:hypothetical protein